MSNNKSYLVDILNRKQKAQLQALTCLWTGAVAIFFLWWFQPSHVADPWCFAFNSFVLGWAIMMPAYYFYFLRRIKKPNPELPIPASYRPGLFQHPGLRFLGSVGRARWT
jgi:hypothetical protein